MPPRRDETSDYLKLLLTDGATVVLSYDGRELQLYIAGERVGPAKIVEDA